MTLLHATCVSLDGHGVLLRGDSGVGKSDLALRLIDRGARLVSDDYVNISMSHGDLIAAAPDTIRGLLEVRGIGVVEVPFVTSVTIRLLVDLMPSDEIPRLPEPAWETLDDVTIDRIVLAPLEASTEAKLRLALRAARYKIRHT